MAAAATHPPAATVSAVIHEYDTFAPAIGLDGGGDAHVATKKKTPERTFGIDVSISLPEGERGPCHAVCMIDLSGSMNSGAGGEGLEGSGFSALDLVKHSLTTLIHALAHTDFLTLITFATEAKIVFSTQLMTEEGKAAALLVVKGLVADGYTNIWAALRTALKCVADFRAAKMSGDVDIVSTLFLLTDGQESQGRPKEGTCAAFGAALDEVGQSALTLHTLGYGYTLDSKMLRQLAEMGQGVYGFIPDATMVGTIFVNLIATMLATAHAHLHVSISQLPDAHFASRAADTRVFDAGLLLFGQTRGFHVRVPTKMKAVAAGVISFSAQRPSGEHVSLAAIRIVNGTVDGGAESGGAGAGVSVAAAAAAIPAPAADSSPTPPSSAPTHTDTPTTLALAIPPTPTASPAYTRELCAQTLLLLAQEPQPKVFTQLCKLVTKHATRAAGKDREYFDSLLSDLEGETAETGQIGKAMQADFHYRWGKHYLAGLALCHGMQVQQNYKDKSLQHYGGSLFIRIQQTIESIFVTLPTPTPSRPCVVSHFDSAPHHFDNFEGLYRARGCIDGDCRVHVCGRGLVPLRDICRGEEILGSDGSFHVVECLVVSPPEGTARECEREGEGEGKGKGENKVDTIPAPTIPAPTTPPFLDELVLFDVAGVLLTPYHPVWQHNRWCFPLHIGKPFTPPTPTTVYNLLLAAGSPDAMVWGPTHTQPVRCVTLAHNITDDVVASHDYLGTSHVRADLQCMRGWASGRIVLDETRTRRDLNGRVCAYVERA